MQLLVPEPGGTGAIRSAEFPSKCLDAPGMGQDLMWWDCRTGSKRNTMFKMPHGTYGYIRSVAHPGKCLTIQGGTTNGKRLQLGNCLHPYDGSSAASNFSVRTFLDCWWWCDANNMVTAGGVNGDGHDGLIAELA